MKYSTFAVLIVGIAIAAGPVVAQQASIAGDWTLSIEHLGLKMVLEQKKTIVTGTLDWPHGDPIKLTGLLADDTLVLSGDSAGENFTIHIDATGTRKADGTLAGKKILWDFGPNVRGIDGMTLDQNGAIYATAGRGEAAGIYVFSPAGEPLAFLPTPGDPTNCVFGLGKDVQMLYITADGPKPTSEDKKRRFGLYRIRLATKGYHVFAGNAGQ